MAKRLPVSITSTRASRYAGIARIGMIADKQYTEMGTVILATGGYAADFTPDSLLKKHRPEYYDLVRYRPLIPWREELRPSQQPTEITVPETDTRWQC